MGGGKRENGRGGGGVAWRQDDTLIGKRDKIYRHISIESAKVREIERCSFKINHFLQLQVPRPVPVTVGPLRMLEKHLRVTQSRYCVN